MGWRDSASLAADPGRRVRRGRGVLTRRVPIRIGAPPRVPFRNRPAHTGRAGNPRSRPFAAEHRNAGSARRQRVLTKSGQ